MGDWNKQKCRVFLHQKEHHFWWSVILVTGIIKPTLWACNSLSIPLWTNLSFPWTAVLMPLKNVQRPLVSKIQQQTPSICICSCRLYHLWRAVLYFCVPRMAQSLDTFTHYLGYFFFFCSSSFFSQISSPALIITIGSGWIKDLSHLIQWHKYETFIIYSTRRSAKDKFTCDTCKINSYLFLTDFH